MNKCDFCLESYRSEQGIMLCKKDSYYYDEERRKCCAQAIGLMVTTMRGNENGNQDN